MLVCVRARVNALRIVSRDDILRFKSTVRNIIIILLLIILMLLHDIISMLNKK